MVVLVDPDKGITNPNLQTYLKDLPVTSFSKAPAFLLKPGYSLWAPFGWQPIVVGAPQHAFNIDDQTGKPIIPKDPVFETITYGITIAWDKCLHQEPLNVRLHVAGMIVQRHPFTFKFVKENADVQEWKKLNSASTGSGNLSED